VGTTSGGSTDGGGTDDSTNGVPVVDGTAEPAAVVIGSDEPAVQADTTSTKPSSQSGERIRPILEP
jgi:hypothetical protein